MLDVIAVLIATIVIVAAINGNSNTSIMNNISRDHHMPLFQIFRYILITSLKAGAKITYIANLCYKFNLLSQHSTSNYLLIRSGASIYVICHQNSNHQGFVHVVHLKNVCFTCDFVNMAR